VSWFQCRTTCYDTAVPILIDEPLWWFKGRKWSHLVSDTSIDELQAFADSVGIPRHGFQGDHYDVPEEMYGQMVAGGAQPTPSRELLRRLRGAGLRLGPAERRARRDNGVGYAPGAGTADPANQ
jgi:hypothetical protein